MEEQLIKTPVRFVNDESFIRNADGVLIAETYGLDINVETGELTPIGEYIALCINQHTALLAVAEAAEKYLAIPLGRSDGHTHQCKRELEAKLAAWRKG